MFSIRRSAFALLTALCACGSQGAGGSNSNTGAATYGAIALVSHVPAADAVQVPLDGSITLRFDARMVLDCTRHPDTWLRPSGSSSNVDGTWALADSGLALVFTPSAPLAAETDYVMSVSPLTCDQEGRILETATTFSFRTLDSSQPSVVSADVTPNQTGRSRTAPFTIAFGEAIAAASVTANSVILRDVFNQRYECDRTVVGNVLSVRPVFDLPGDRRFTLQVNNTVSDRAGNPLTATWSCAFWTANDVNAPSATSVWPAGGSTDVSPFVQPIVTFDESMDPDTVEPSSLVFQDQFGSLVGYTVVASPDRRTLRVCPTQPLASHRDYVLAFLVSGAAVTDVSGNPLTATTPLAFRTGVDAVPLVVASSVPAAQATRVSINVEPTLVFAEDLDPVWAVDGNVELRSGGSVVPAVLSNPTPDTLVLTPILPLAPRTTYSVWLRGGHSGLRDRAGNVMPSDLELVFSTADDATLPTAMLQPSDGTNGVPQSMHASLVFGSALDPSTVHAGNFELRTDAGAAIDFTIDLTGSDRVVVLRPTNSLAQNTYYRTFVRGGPTGVREASGNWLAHDLGARWRTGSSPDFTPPAVTATVNAIDANRRNGLVLPGQGFTIDVDASDGLLAPDMGSVRVELSGPVPAPDPESFYATAVIGFRSFDLTFPSTAKLAAGTWQLSVTVRDLAGNVGTSPTVTFTVAEPTPGLVPFERTQVVWTRMDMDRDGNGRADFEDDMLRLGLATSGDPSETNAYVRELARDAILARANELYGRGSRGEPLGADSVAIRFTPFEPIALPHLQIAVGGLDPQGSRNRSYGDPTSGVLGRAYYDYRNANVNDRNVGTSPGLGVFPAEMFLYQVDLHLQLYPSFLTMFAQRFLPLVPQMGGVPAGSHAADGVVLRAGFDPGSATSEQYARWLVVMRAIDDWAMVIGTVLAHEVGHAVGLTAPGAAPSGLFGDNSLHNANASSAEVMAPAVGYEAMVSLDYHFRDTNMAYLRHRILLR